MIQKVQAYIVRWKKTPELLVFQHELTKLFQVIRGTIDSNESPEVAILREIVEESGLTTARIINKLAEFEIQIPGGPKRVETLETQIHHAFLLEISEVTPDEWTHIARGSQAEEGLKFHFCWQPIDQRLYDLLKMIEMNELIPSLIKATKEHSF